MPVRLGLRSELFMFSLRKTVPFAQSLLNKKSLVFVLVVAAVWFYPDAADWVSNRMTVAWASGPALQAGSNGWRYQHVSHRFSAFFGDTSAPQQVKWQWMAQPAKHNPIPHTARQDSKVGFGQWLKERYLGKPEYTLDFTLDSVGYTDTTAGQLARFLQPRMNALKPKKAAKINVEKQLSQFFKESKSPAFSLDTTATTDTSLLFTTEAKDLGVVYTVVPHQGVKENITLYYTKSMEKACMTSALTKPNVNVFKECPLPANSFTFTVKADPGTQLLRTPDNVWYFADDKGRYLGHFANLLAIDNAQAQTNALSLEVLPSKTPDEITLTLTVDLRWLIDPARSYPIIIDPSVIYDDSTDFSAGIFDRTKDTGSGASPRIEAYYEEAPADQYTLALWHLEEGTGSTTVDRSGNGNTGTLTSGPTWNTSADSRIGNSSLTFDGTDDFVTVPHNAALHPTDFTLEFWIYPIAWANDWSDIIQKGIGAGSVQQWYVRENNTSGVEFTFQNSFSLYETIVSRSLVPLGTWTHLAYVVDQNSRFAVLYVNGIPRGSTGVDSAGVATASTAALTFGGFSWDGYSNLRMDDIRISNIPRSSDEIKSSALRPPSSAYTSGVLDLSSVVTDITTVQWTENGVQTGDGETPFSTTGLIAQWNLNSTSGTSATNDAGSCGATCNGTLTTFASTGSQDAAAATGWTTINKRWGAGALMFDGANDYVNVGDQAALDFTDSFSITAWVKANVAPAAGNYPAIAGKAFLGGGAGFNGYGLYLNGDLGGTASFQARSEGSATAVNSPYSIADGSWHYLVGVRDHSTDTTYLYLDGELMGSNTAALANYTSTTSFTIGARDFSGTPGFFFPGVIDSVQVYGRILTASEILSNYQAGNIQFQTRTGTDTTPDDGNWEAWTPTTGETQIDSLDSNEPATNIHNWSVVNPFNNQTWVKFDNTTPAVSDTTNTNGRLGLGNAGRADSVSAYEPEVIKDGSTYKMWYVGNDGTNTRILYASSPDGYTWTKLDNTIPAASDTTGTNGRIPLGTNGRGDDAFVYNASVIKDGSTYKMWYSGYDGSNYRIYYATSSDGLTWTKLDNTVPANSDGSSTNGRIPLGTAGRGDSNGALGPHVMKDGSTYKMWYHGQDGSNVGRIYYATSSDGLAWTKLDNTIPANSDSSSSNGRIPLGTSGRIDSSATGRPNVIKEGGLYKMWYGTVDGTNNRIAYATSVDGLTWNKFDNSTPTVSNKATANGRLALGTGSVGDNTHVFTPSVLYDNGLYRMWYMGHNGSNWRTFYAAMAADPHIQSTDSVIKQEGSAAERFDLGKAQIDGGTAGLWHLDETGGSGAYIKDSSIYANHGTPTGTTVTAGISGRARQFNGSSDRITVPATTGSLDIDAVPVTLEAWIKLDTLGVAHGIVHRGTAGADGYGMSVQTTGVVNCGTHGGSNFDGTTVLAPGRWYYVACVVDGTASRLYINGALDATGTSVTVPASTLQLIIGANWVSAAYAQFFDGAIDEVRVSNTARTAEEIAETYRNSNAHPLSRVFSSIDLTTSNTLPFFIAGDRPGSTFTVTYGESPYVNYEFDNNTVYLGHLEEPYVPFFRTASPGTGANLAGVGTVAWTNPGNVTASDFTYATASLNNSTSNYLRASNYNFAIPSGAQILGIEVKIARTASANSRIRDNQVRIVNAAGTVGSAAREDTSTFWTTSTVTATYGSQTDLWGLTWNAADINDTDFGAVVSAVNTVATATTASVDYIQILVHYSTGSADSTGVASASYLTDGVIGKARGFDGSNDVLTVPTVRSVTGANRTLEAWVKFNSFDSADFLVGKINEMWLMGTTGGGLCPANTIGFAIYDGDWQCAYTPTLTTNQWYYLVGTYDGTNIRFYVNGQLVGGPTAQGAPTPQVTGLDIGGFRSNLTFGSNAIIDEVRFSNAVRSAQEIRQAYDYVTRSHTVTITFGALLDSGNVITGSGDTSFTIDGTVYGATNKGDNLYPGDTVIVRENYNGTEYRAQAVVTAVTPSTGAVTVASWAGASTFPSGGQTGFSANAEVFKWQREQIDLSGSLIGTGSGDTQNQRNATTRLTIRPDGRTGRSVWLDDVRYTSAYLTTASGSTTTSTTQRYAQVRGLFTTSDGNVSPWLSQTQLNFTSSPPNDLFLRHGKFFNEGQKQPFWWAQ